MRPTPILFFAAFSAMSSFGCTDAAYEGERQPIGNTIVMHSRKLGTHMGVNLKTEEDRSMHELLQDDGAMMDWIAVPNFLDAYK